MIMHVPADGHCEVKSRHCDRSRVICEEIGDNRRRNTAVTGFSDTDQCPQ